MPRLGSTTARLKLKGIDGGPHKRWSMWFNSIQREEPYLGLNRSRKLMKVSPPARDCCRGAAWLSSARVVDVGLSPATSATLVLSCHQVMLGTLRRLPRMTRRKVGMTSSPHGPYVQGYTRATMVGTVGCKTARWSQSPKPASVQIGVCNSTP